jgi:hypothetical protein
MESQPLVNQVIPTTGFGTAPLGAAIPPMPGAVPLMPGGTTIPSAIAAPIVPAPHMSPVGAATSISNVVPIGPGATSTPRSSIASLDKTASIESPLGYDFILFNTI